VRRGIEADEEAVNEVAGTGGTEDEGPEEPDCYKEEEL
jgi:hypothetical protein